MHLLCFALPFGICKYVCFKFGFLLDIVPIHMCIVSGPWTRDPATVIFAGKTEDIILWSYMRSNYTFEIISDCSNKCDKIIQKNVCYVKNVNMHVQRKCKRNENLLLKTIGQPP